MDKVGMLGGAGNGLVGVMHLGNDSQVVTYQGGTTRMFIVGLANMECGQQEGMQAIQLQAV